MDVKGAFSSCGSAGPEFEEGVQVLSGEGSLFGRRLVIKDDRMLVASDVRDLVHVYWQDSRTWHLEASLRAPATHRGGNFATSMAVNGTLLVIGSRGMPGQEGAAFVYEATAGGGWGQPVLLSPPSALYREGRVSESFGNEVHVGNDGSLFVSVPGQDAVCVYHKRNGAWALSEVIRAPVEPGVVYIAFGNWLAAEGDRLVIAAPGASLPADGEGAGFESFGAVFLYERGADGGWTLRNRVRGEHLPGGPKYGLGSPLYIRDGLVVAGAHESVHLFDAATLAPVARLTHPDPQRMDHIGRDLAIGEGFVAAGMALRNSGRGAVLVFRPDAAGVWGPSHVVEREAEKSGEFFGWAVAADGPNLVVGAPGIGPGRREDGRVFVYRGDGR